MERLSRKEQKQKTRHGLVEKAAVLFAKQGIAATATADVAKASQVSHGTVFIHFATREDLIIAVVDKIGERLSQALGRKLSDRMPLKELLHAHLAVLAEFEEIYIRLIGEAQDLPAPVRSLLYAMNASLSYRFYSAGRALMKEGKIKKMEQAVFFNTWMALLHYHLLNRDLFSDKTPVLSEIGDDLLHQFMTLIKT